MALLLREAHLRAGVAIVADFRIEVRLHESRFVDYIVRVFDDIEEAAHELGGNELVTAVDNAAQWLYAGEYTDEQYENYERWLNK